MKKLEGKVAIVSGSGRGIGRAIAMKLASEGAKVVVNDLDAGPAEETVAAIKAAGGQALACAGSVTADGFAETFVKTAIDGFGGLDIIVISSGLTPTLICRPSTSIDALPPAVASVRRVLIRPKATALTLTL